MNRRHKSDELTRGLVGLHTIYGNSSCPQRRYGAVGTKKAEG